MISAISDLFRSFNFFYIAFISSIPLHHVLLNPFLFYPIIPFVLILFYSTYTTKTDVTKELQIKDSQT